MKFGAKYVDYQLDDSELKLIEELQSLLESTTRLKQLERQNQEAQQTQETFYKVPYQIYIG